MRAAEIEGKWVCSVCAQRKPIAERASGRQQCKPCVKVRRAEKNAEWRAANREQIAAKNRRLYLANREAILERHRARQVDKRDEILEYQRGYYQTNRARIAGAARARREANPELVAERGRRWRRENPERAAEAVRRYHARRRGAERVEPGVTWMSVAERDGMSCRYCGVECDPADGYHVEARDGARRWVCGPTYPSLDHVVPVSRGGHHTMSNAVLSCTRCNKRKGAHVIAEKTGRSS